MAVPPRFGSGSLKPRSLVFNLYGDYVRYYGGEIGLQNLLPLLDIFGVSEQTTRVTLSRLKREGWLESRRVGRRSWYSLTPRAWRMLDGGRERIFQRRRDSWNGDWHMIIYQVPEAERPVREQLRKALRWLGFGPLGPSTWVSAHNRFRELEETLADRGINATYQIFTARTGSLERDRELANRSWDLTALRDNYRAFVGEHRQAAREAKEKQLSDEQCFVRRVHMVHDYRKFPYLDPDLPLELLPRQWAGVAAHGLFTEIWEALSEPALQYFEAHFEPPP